MSFNPTSTIYMCAVPFDSTYAHQIYFEDKETQENYFIKRAIKTYSEYLVVRKEKPDGGMYSSVTVEANIDDLYACNYMMYRNENHGARWFYAFITKLVYVNEETVEVVFETDVYQTWRFDVELQRSFVVREHSETDEIGENVVPEPISYQDFFYEDVSSYFTYTNENGNSNAQFDNSLGYLFVCSEKPHDDYVGEGALHSGVYQGIYFYYFEKVDDVNTFIRGLDDEGKDSIISITMIPKFAVKNATIGGVQNILGSDGEKHTLTLRDGFVHGTGNPATTILTADVVDIPFGYIPSNKKLYTAPFRKLLVSNNNGNIAEYAIEDFDDPSAIAFYIYADISSSPTMCAVPINYKGVYENIDCSISLSGFPQCSFNNDTYKLWLAKNQYSNAITMGTSMGSIGVGVAMAMTGVGGMAGAGMIVGGATAIANLLANNHKMTIEPNQANVPTPRNNLLTAMQKNKFTFKIQYLKDEYMEILDNYFTMFGYATNRVKFPNVSSRPKFNYVKTVDVNIVGKLDKYGQVTTTIPSDDMGRLKAMYNNGVTLWKPTAKFLDYSANNAPT